ncbi:hypothetical protein [Pedobacter puniceum]|jgi:copper chaperone NosL|uniref:Copper chaperone NosL n=1 Tax=Pedobacter puniceum TaxID=2666136 RepID=A0A7K0FR24_9SPHI|nr:hypothetical protein [Pedobacter puniceum]MRX48446.1 hypothetical protein [Pedobacter puniceum]
MKKKSRIIIAISGLLLLSAYFLPLWQIILEAPQYPEGLGLKIWLNNITGNVDQINGLNHYIGMKHIVVEDFIEFKIVPYVFTAIVLTAFLTATIGNKKLLWFLFILLMSFSVVGLVDFYLWEYDYGHNLDPKAAIKVPGMSYQPPLIGYKQLLNFLAGSFPDIGGVFISIAVILVGLTLFMERNIKSLTS